MFVDLHVHSTYSDGMLTPEELAAQAVAAGVSVIAKADHDTIEGREHMRRACHEAGIGCIDAVEIDTIYRGEDYHVLAYGYDGDSAAFAEHVRFGREKLDNMTWELMALLQAEGKPISREDYESYPETVGRGGWKGLYYLQDRLGFDSCYPVFSLYPDYGITYAQARFAPMELTLRRIHEAGGIAILAHPGDASRMEAAQDRDMCAMIEELFALGLDGVECFYPKHSPEETERFVQLCRKHGKLITSGSDCHGAFSGKPVGYMKKTREDLNLGPLLEMVNW